MIVAVGAFLIANGALDMTLASRSRSFADMTIAVAGIALGILTLCGYTI